ncbi:hypothetical protein BJ742DRAFT_735601 [Cladochytrium replicatum]|nr:hypothetical protein BJ742DRAFT_735601 [Cladochytrium replicatum]
MRQASIQPTNPIDLGRENFPFLATKELRKFESSRSVHVMGTFLSGLKSKVAKAYTNLRGDAVTMDLVPALGSQGTFIVSRGEEGLWIFHRVPGEEVERRNWRKEEQILWMPIVDWTVVGVPQLINDDYEDIHYRIRVPEAALLGSDFHFTYLKKAMRTHHDQRRMRSLMFLNDQGQATSSAPKSERTAFSFGGTRVVDAVGWSLSNSCPAGAQVHVQLPKWSSTISPLEQDEESRIIGGIAASKPASPTAAVAPVLANASANLRRTLSRKAPDDAASTWSPLSLPLHQRPSSPPSPTSSSHHVKRHEVQIRSVVETPAFLAAHYANAAFAQEMVGIDEADGAAWAAKNELMSDEDAIAHALKLSAGVNSPPPESAAPPYDEDRALAQALEASRLESDPFSDRAGADPFLIQRIRAIFSTSEPALAELAAAAAPKIR